MTMSAPDDRLYVVVGVLTDSCGRVFIQQRKVGTPKAGKWEFPGGKLEQGETPEQGLSRELREELNIRVNDCLPLVTTTHDYDHARVWLDTYLIKDFLGQPVGHEGQQIAWVEISRMSEFDLLPAVFPIVDALVEYVAQN